MDLFTNYSRSTLSVCDLIYNTILDVIYDMNDNFNGFHHKAEYAELYATSEKVLFSQSYSALLFLVIIATEEQSTLPE